MCTRYYERFPLETDGILRLMELAAMRILRRQGQMTLDAEGPMLVAYVDGYTIRSYPRVVDACEDPVAPESGRGRLPDASSETFCIDIEASELLFGLAIDAKTLSVRRMVRGPWEHGILQAAGMIRHFVPSRPIPPCVPESRSRSTWPLSALRTVRRRRLRRSVRFSVAGYSQCIHTLLPPGSGFDDIAAAVGEGYRESRLRDGHIATNGEPETCFGIWGWAGDRTLRFGKRMTKPDVAYWISPTGGCEAAAAILLLLDRDRPRP
jgi:hypothetical protein